MTDTDTNEVTYSPLEPIEEGKVLSTSFPLGVLWKLDVFRRDGGFVLNATFGDGVGKNERKFTLSLLHAHQLTAATGYKVEITIPRRGQRLDKDLFVLEGNKKVMDDAGHAVEITFSFLGESFQLTFPFRDYMDLAPFLGSHVNLNFVVAPGIFVV